jgi:RNA polymerase sigma-70 factor (ECF subfamily)
MIPNTILASGPTSLSLLERVRQNDPEAWRRFVRLYGGMVYGWARRWQLQEADAADVMQDVFQSVYRSLPQYRPDGNGSFHGWLWTIALNKTRDLIRTRRRHPETPGGEALQNRLFAVPDPVEDDLFPEATGPHVNLLIRAAELIRDEFDAKSWTCFERMVIEGVPAADVAGELGMTVGAVRQAKYRVLRYLRAFCSDFL